MLLKHVYNGLKISQTSKLDISFSLELFFYPVAIFTQAVSAPLKLREELCVMAMKNDAKFDIELTCHFKTDMRNLTSFDPSTQKS